MWFFPDLFIHSVSPHHAPSRDLSLLLPSSERPRRRSDVTCATRKWTRRSTASSQREVGSVAPACPLHPGAAAPGVATQSNAADSRRSRVQGMGRGLWARRHVALQARRHSRCCCGGLGGLGGFSWMAPRRAVVAAEGFLGRCTASARGGCVLIASENFRASSWLLEAWGVGSQCVHTCRSLLCGLGVRCSQHQAGVNFQAAGVVFLNPACS